MRPASRYFFLKGLVLIFFLNYFSSFSQLAVLQNNNAQALAQKIVGNGITVSNASLNSGINASGTFTYTGTHLGLRNGVILTTGAALTAANNGNFFCNVNNGNQFSDPDLTAISPQGRFDVCILEFDFVPLCDTLRIDYVFGSEEYPKAIYAAYNDVFGIFLTGPKPGGGSYSSTNIATLPNGYTPVSIDSINAGWPIGTNASHFEYYVDNYSAPNNDIAYNGYTRPVTSKAALITCAKYHIKIAIADGGNALYDSGVFIEGSSFSCINPPIVSSSAINSCANMGTVSVNVSNYQGTPSYTWIPGNLHNDTLKNVSPGTYVCIIDLPGVCGNYSVSATVTSSQTLSVASSTTFVCRGNSARFEASGMISYTWSPAYGLNNANVYDPIATPSVSTTYSVAGTGTNGCVSNAAVTLSVSGLASPPSFIASAYEVSVDNDSIQFNANSGETFYYWDFGDGSTDTTLNPHHSFNDPGTYIVSLTAFDSMHCSETVAKEIIVNDIMPDLFTFYMPNAFTPNGDHINDVLQAKGTGWDPASFQLNIYNRWGSTVFSTRDAKGGWDGRSEREASPEPGVYTWRVILKDIYKREHSFMGHVTLTR